jgi:hypothetical protein
MDRVFLRSAFASTGVLKSAGDLGTDPFMRGMAWQKAIIVVVFRRIFRRPIWTWTLKQVVIGGNQTSLDSPVAPR